MKLTLHFMHERHACISTAYQLLTDLRCFSMPAEPFHPHPFPNETLTADFSTSVVTPNQLRWRPIPIPSEPGVDFLRGTTTMCGAGRWVLGAVGLTE
jgi:homogentisate 1,2-dioxygenase